MNHIDFQVQGSKVKITIEYCLKISRFHTFSMANICGRFDDPLMDAVSSTCSRAFKAVLNSDLDL